MRVKTKQKSTQNTTIFSWSSLYLHPSPALQSLHSHYFFYAGFFASICVTLFIPFLEWVCTGKPLLHQTREVKSFSLNVFLPEVFRVCIIAHVLPQKIYVLFKCIYFLSLNLKDAEREHLSYHSRQSTEVPHLCLQERHPIDQDYTEFTFFSIGSEIGSFYNWAPLQLEVVCGPGNDW